MGIAQTLTLQQIRQFIQAEEIPLRRQFFSENTVNTVLKYGAVVGSVLETFPQLDRGMDHARRLIRRHEEAGTSFPSGQVIVADELTGGKGRFQRYWHAPAGGVWLTLVLVNTLLAENNSFYPLAAGVACCETINHYLPQARLKWVNDVHVSGRKIAGILIETMVGPIFGEEYIMIGVGINVNNDSFPDELSGLAVSLKGLTGREEDVQLLTCRLLAKLSWNMGLVYYEEQRGMEDDIGLSAGEKRREHYLLSRYRQLSDSVGRRVLFGHDVQKSPQYEAVVQGFDQRGALLLQLDDGTIVEENSGEITYLD
ncbi:MAG: biotin--[acetyl-CoA-carboxylase] ligase [Proteobacteria bacterium]|nr:biotin--[acetyl-CoA-carboxylase] ligase [Pseudomonadota bacterium]MBU1715244.1 biotin--[acetyl-CoA-carboxylase] ligase [Pseudomonadota bacterium]